MKGGLSWNWELRCSQGIGDVAARLRGVTRNTPVLTSRTLDEDAGCRCYLKAENLQETGAFKVRGAFAAMTAGAGPRKTGPRTVVTASAGNFGQGIAFGARHLGSDALVVVPRGTPRIKRRRIEALGGRVEVHGDDFDEADATARRLAQREGLTFISPFDDPRVIEGQGTLGLELLGEVPRLDALVVPCGGGGLLAGVSLVVKAIDPRVKVVAVEPGNLPSLGAALSAGRPCRLPPERTLADGIAVRQIGRLPLTIVRRLVDDVVTVSEKELAEAMRYLALELKQIVEGAGAAALAAVLRRPPVLASCQAVGVLLTGGNIDPETIASIMG